MEADDAIALLFSVASGRRFGLLGDLDGGQDELVMRGSLEEGALPASTCRKACSSRRSCTAKTTRRRRACLSFGATVSDRRALENAGTRFDAFDG
jgi:hypothetical protein